MTTLLLLVVTAGLAVGIVAASVQAMSQGDAQQLIDQNKSRIDAANRAIEQAKARESGLSGDIASLDQKLLALGASIAEMQSRIATVQTDLTKTRAELTAQKAELARAQQELDAARVRLAVQQTVLEERVVATYKAGDTTYIDVMVSAKDFSDLVGDLQTMSILVGNDNTIASDLRQAKADIAAEELAARKAAIAIQVAASRLADQQASLVKLRARLEAQQAQVRAARNSTSAVLETVATSRKAWEQQKADLEAQSAQAAAIVSGNTSGGHSGKNTGSMIWPVSGGSAMVTSEYGMRLNPITGETVLHAGIDIGAPMGTTIMAADGGTVISILGPDESAGGGNVTFIRHSDAVVTVYMHQSAISVSVGQVVAKGQAIGAVGSTGNSTGPHLHFGVLVNGSPVNPRGYLP